MEYISLTIPNTPSSPLQVCPGVCVWKYRSVAPLRLRNIQYSCTVAVFYFYFQAPSNTSYFVQGQDPRGFSVPSFLRVEKKFKPGLAPSVSSSSSMHCISSISRLFQINIRISFPKWVVHAYIRDIFHHLRVRPSAIPRRRVLFPSLHHSSLLVSGLDLP